MTKEVAVEMVREFAEGRGSYFNLDRWIDFTIQKIVNQRMWWWRKIQTTFTLTVGTNEYDLSAAGLNIADDFFKMIHLAFIDGNGKSQEIIRETDPLIVQDILAGTLTSDDPATYIIKPGTTKTIVFSSDPSNARTVTMLYWSAHDPVEPGLNPSEEIPLIPRPYHYVVVQHLKVPFMETLFGQTDPRYATSKAEAAESMRELEAFREPSTRERHHLIVGKNIHAVQSTR